jgi:hypothetical protein
MRRFHRDKADSGATGAGQEGGHWMTAAAFHRERGVAA